MSPAVDRGLRSRTEASSPQPIEALTAALPEIPGYALVKPLGKGGMGIVYLARELALDRNVALKVLPPGLAEDPAAVERFRREAVALARVDHANIVPIHAIGEQQGLLYFTMAYVEGETLSDVLQAARTGRPSRFAPYFLRRRSGDHRRDLAAAVVAHQIARALADLHAIGIVHRDIKPANVLMDQHGRPVLVDFGVACDLAATRRSGDALSPCTLRFMPPEYLAGERSGAVDPRADVYALGATLYELVTLAPAFPQQDFLLLVDAIREGDFATPRTLDAAVPAELEQIIGCAMSLEPSKRFADAREMADALSALIGRYARRAEFADLALGPGLDPNLSEGATGSEHGRGAVRERGAAWLRRAGLLLVGAPVLLALGYQSARWLSAVEPAAEPEAAADSSLRRAGAADAALAEPDERQRAEDELRRLSPPLGQLVAARRGD